MYIPIKGGGKHLKGHTSQAHTCHRGTKTMVVKVVKPALLV